MGDVFVMKQNVLGAGWVDHFATDRATIIRTACDRGGIKVSRRDISRVCAALEVVHRKSSKPDNQMRNRSAGARLHRRKSEPDGGCDV
jgi:hypothetical protein